MISLTGTFFGSADAELAELLGQGEQHLCRLARAQMLGEYAEHDPRDPPHIARLGMLLELAADEVEEFLLMANPARLAQGIPSFVIETADQHRQLRSELRRVFAWQPIAQRMQGCPQRGERRSVIGKAQPVGNVVEPFVGLLDRAVEHWKLAHHRPPAMPIHLSRAQDRRR